MAESKGSENSITWLAIQESSLAWPIVHFSKKLRSECFSSCYGILTDVKADTWFRNLEPQNSIRKERYREKWLC